MNKCFVHHTGKFILRDIKANRPDTAIKSYTQTMLSHRFSIRQKLCPLKDETI